MEMRPQLKVSSDRLVKPEIKSATPRLQGKWFIHYTTVAPHVEQEYWIKNLFRIGLLNKEFGVFEIVVCQNLILEVTKYYMCSFFGGLILYVPVNSYGHVRTGSSPNHFFLGNLA